MSIRPRDPLLRAARILTNILLGLLAIITLAMPVGTAAVWLNAGRLAAELGPRAGDIGPVSWAITMLLTGFFLFALMGLQFLRQLRRIIGTVGEGEPFTEANADRLTQMGWIIAAVQLVALLLSGLADYVSAQFPEKDLVLDVNLSLEGVLMALVLFILARIFRLGTAMREDLEGTV